MEIIKKIRARPRVLTDEERKHNKTNYHLTKEWICPICKPSHNYTIAGKHCHMKTKKHQKNKQRWKQAIVINSENNVTVENM